ncbi:alpha-amylase family glycosyl hydrolase [Roseateles sp. PN1]|uniref:alpha-amylase family glycosyl hydrolase n=1 Tax=Roseateles sp. PN1 TaxID=3137372 RepID=UPI00313A4CC0
MPRWPAAALAASLLSLSSLASLAQAETSKASATAHSKAVAAPASFAGRIQAKRDWRQGSFMEIFVRGYQDSDGDGIGDLRGLTQRLDYLQDLGISGIWLMPITPSADRDHGYATTDYRGIEAQYGSMADFEELLHQAHRRGIGVIVDYVINHSAAEHPFFQEAAADRNSPYRDWFVWQDPAPTGWDIWGKNPWYANAAGGHYFATFGAPMPDFNLRNPAVVDYHRASMRFWLDKGLDGFRLDAVPHMIENDAVRWNDQPESRQLTLEFQQLIKSAPQRYSVCEATANPQAYADTKVCGSAFAFGLQYEVIKAAKGEPKAIQAVADYFKTAPLSMATMLSNHDIFAGQRLWDQMQGQTQPVKRYKLAAATYLLQPGIPFIYYGEEIGMAGVPGLEGDEPLRAPMSWTADAKGGFSPAGSSSQPFRPLAPNRLSHNAQTQAQDPDSILNFYKAMLQLRNQHPALTQGSYVHPQVQGQVLRFERKHGAERVLVVINYGEQEATLRLRDLKPGTRLAPLYPAGAARLSAKPLTLAPLSLQVYRLQTPKH